MLTAEELRKLRDKKVFSLLSRPPEKPKAEKLKRKLKTSPKKK
jgi:hypothetical protein